MGGGGWGACFGGFFRASSGGLASSIANFPFGRCSIKGWIIDLHRSAGIIWWVRCGSWGNLAFVGKVSNDLFREVDSLASFLRLRPPCANALLSGIVSAVILHGSVFSTVGSAHLPDIMFTGRFDFSFFVASDTETL